MPPKKKTTKPVIVKKKKTITRKIKKQIGGNKTERKRPVYEDGFDDFDVGDDGEIYLRKPWPNGVRPVEEKKPSKPDDFKHRKPIVAPYIERKRWYEKGPIGFIKDNKIASQLLKKVYKPWGRWLEQKGWGDVKTKRKKYRKIKKLK